MTASQTEKKSLRLLFFGEEKALLRLPPDVIGGADGGDMEVELSRAVDETQQTLTEQSYDALLIDRDVPVDQREAVVAWCGVNHPALSVMLFDAESDDRQPVHPLVPPVAGEPAGTGADPAALTFGGELSVLFEAASDMMGLLDEGGRIVRVNRRSVDFLARSPDELHETPFLDWVAERDRAAVRECLESLADGQRARCEIRLRSEDGERIGLATFAVRPGGAIFIVNDVTAQRQAQERLLEDNRQLMAERERLRRLATLDELTGLYNRRHCRMMLENQLRESRQLGFPVSLAMIDLDRFKRINDTYGHLLGDRVLREVSRLIRQGVRSSDTAARYGGEEIAVILPHAAEESAYRLVERLRERCMRLELDADGAPVRVSFSAGIATYPSEGIASAEDLIRKADDNLYDAKLQGRNRSVSDRFGRGDEASVARNGDGEGQRRVLNRFSALAEEFGRGLVGELHTLTASLEMKSGYSAKHSHDVMLVSRKLAIAAGLDADTAERVACAGYLHDVGLIAVPDLTLAKSGKLTASEWAKIRRHPEWGRGMLREIPLFTDEPEWVYGHHERLDGSGYPQGLKGSQISLPCQILSIADVFSAMTTDRPYQRARTREEALSVLDDHRDVWFPSELVDLLIASV